MAGQIGFGTRITEMWFDRDYVLKRVDAGAQKVLSRFGYFVMRDARQSIRKPRQMTLAEMSPEQRETYRRRQAIAKSKGKMRPKKPFAPSEPGKPPRNQMGLLKNFIFFSYDAYSRGVVIGPALLPSARSNPPIPQVLEEGGVVQNRRMGRGARIRPRPYMQPAFDRQMDKNMPQMWRNAL